MFGLFSGKDDIEADTRVCVGIDEAAVNGQRVEDVGRGMSILYTCRAMGLDAREGIHFRIIMRAIEVRSRTPKGTWRQASRTYPSLSHDLCGSRSGRERSKLRKNMG